MTKFLFGLLCTFCTVTFFAQVPGNWHLLDLENDGYPGISAYKASALLEGKECTPVIVAIIDNGAEITHKDLKGMIWANPGEIAGNGIDDDQNGYVDDIHGWNFIGHKNGTNLKMETLGLARLYRRLRDRFQGVDKKEVPASDRADYEWYEAIEAEWRSEVESKEKEIGQIQQTKDAIAISREIIAKYLGKKKWKEKHLAKIKSADDRVLAAKNMMTIAFQYGLTEELLDSELKRIRDELNIRLNPDYNGRSEFVGDNPDDLNDTDYGNNQVGARGPSHGTGVSCTVGALRNKKGQDGVAECVQLMILRVVPHGDELDKDIALAFRYAVRNGATIINCSFGKKYGLHPEFVQEALKEAEDAGVLIVHAAGNDAANIDSVPNHPNRSYADGSLALNWLNVGASGPTDSTLIAEFSNYGARSVDVFAPGTDIEACTTRDRFTSVAGTSIAAPVVSGIAAVLKAYYPKLQAEQLRALIMASAEVPANAVVHRPGSLDIVPFEDLAVAPGIVNLFRALKLAEQQYGTN